MADKYHNKYRIPSARLQRRIMQMKVHISSPSAPKTDVNSRM